MDIKVTRAKIELMLTSPFWGSLATRLELKDWDGDTFATNGKYLFCPDPKYYENWTFSQLVFVIAHETWHCAGGHLFRMKDKDHFTWNVATDLATNFLLQRNNFHLAPGGLNDPEYNEMTAEKIYQLLVNNNNEQEKNKKSKEGEKSDGDETSNATKEKYPDVPRDLIEPEKDPSKKSKEINSSKTPDSGIDPKELEQEWQEGLGEAVRHAHQQGRMPAGMERYIDEILAPKVPWQEVLYRYLQTAKGNTDYTTYPFHRSHIHREMYLPSLRGEMIEVVCGLDNSGSISKDDLTRYFSELRGICSIFGSYTIHLFQADSAIHSYDVITDDSDIPNVSVGGGGTDFTPVFEKILDEQLEELPVVYFSDLDGKFPDNHYGDGVFWLARKHQLNQRRKSVPFGTIVEIND